MNITEWIFTNYECNINISLLTCIKYYNYESFLYFIDQGADINVTDNIRWSPLHYASQKGHKDIVDFLVSHGADVNVTDKYGETPLHIACKEGHKDIIELLVSHGADVNVAYNNG